MQRTVSSGRSLRAARVSTSRTQPPTRAESGSRAQASGALSPAEFACCFTIPAFLLPSRSSDFGPLASAGRSSSLTIEGSAAGARTVRPGRGPLGAPRSERSPFPGNGARGVSSLANLLNRNGNLGRTRTSESSSSLSNFFDGNPTAAKKGSPESLFVHPQRSTAAIQAFRDAITSKSVQAIDSAYNELVEAFYAHREHLVSVAARLNVKPPIGHARHDFQIRKADLQTAVTVILRGSRVRGTIGRRLSQREAQLAKQLFHGIKDVFGFSHSPTDLHYYLWTFCEESPQSAYYADPVEAFKTIRADNPSWRPSVVEFNLVLKALGRRREVGRAQRLLQEMEHGGVELNDKSRTTLATLFYNVGLVDQAEEQLLRIGPREDLKWDALTIAVNGFCMAVDSCPDEHSRQAFRAKARTYCSQLRDQLPASGASIPTQPAWLAVLRCTALLDGPEASLAIVRSWTKRAFVNSPLLSRLLLLQQAELEQLETSDEALALVGRVEALDPTGQSRVDHVCYSALISSLLGRPPSPQQWSRPADGDFGAAQARSDATSSIPADPPNPNQIREAQMLYDHLLASGVVPDAPMMTPLVVAYCDAFLPSLSNALRLVDDALSRAVAAEAKNKRRSSKSAETGPLTAAVLDTDLFNALLRGCARMRDADTARAVLRQMEKHGVRIDETSRVQVATVLMQCSKTWEEAFSVYRRVGRLGSGEGNVGAVQGYSVSGHHALVDVFRKLGLRREDSENDDLDSDDDGCAPPEFVLAMMHDRVSAGHQLGCATYTSLLDYYAKSPRPSYNSVRMIHEAMKEDGTLDPDMALINALLNAYNRTGAPEWVVSIWDNLMVNRQAVDGATLSIVLDMAGRNRMLEFARRALASVRRLESQRRLDTPGSDDIHGTEAVVARPFSTAINKGAWDSWIECLARCGRIEEAVELVFGSMGRQLVRDAHDAGVELVRPKAAGHPIVDAHGRVVGPDAKTLQTLLKFAAFERDRRRRGGGGSRVPWVTGERNGGGKAQSQAGERKLLSPQASSNVAATSAERERMGGSIWHEVRARVQEDMPWLWPSVKDIGVPQRSA